MSGVREWIEALLLGQSQNLMAVLTLVLAAADMNPEGLGGRGGFKNIQKCIPINALMTYLLPWLRL